MAEAAAEARFLAIDIVGKGGEASRGSVVWVLARREEANEGSGEKCRLGSRVRRTKQFVLSSRISIGRGAY